MNHFYWRIVDPTHNATLAHGTAETRDGLVQQISTFLATTKLRNITQSFDGRGCELIITADPHRIDQGQDV